MKIGTRTLVIGTSVIYLGQFCWYALTWQWGRFAALALVLLAGAALALAHTGAVRRWRRERDQTR